MSGVELLDTQIFARSYASYTASPHYLHLAYVTILSLYDAVFWYIIIDTSVVLRCGSNKNVLRRPRADVTPTVHEERRYDPEDTAYIKVEQLRDQPQTRHHLQGTMGRLPNKASSQSAGPALHCCPELM